MISSSRNFRRFRIPLRPDFDFRSTIGSHGWSILPPFARDTAWETLERVFLTRAGTVRASMRSTPGALRIDAESSSPLSPAAAGDLKNQIRTCLRLDEDLGPFHREARRHPEYRWIASLRAGRLLRSPTMFEDAVKIICTTNCTWSLTTMMVSNLVRAVGRKHDATHFAFPRPEDLAGLTEAFLRKEIRTGYRSASLLKLADQVASGKLAIEEWRSGAMPASDALRRMREVHGIGPYAAGNLLRLSGRYGDLALDSWVRGAYYRLHHRGRKVKDATIERAYARFGQWRGLFFWLEMTQGWYADKFRP